MDAREKPHWGVSGVPFMKSTTGAEATALSIAALVSEDKRRAWRTEGRVKAGVRTARSTEGPEIGRKACERRVSWLIGRGHAFLDLRKVTNRESCAGEHYCFWGWSLKVVRGVRAEVSRVFVIWSWYYLSRCTRWLPLRRCAPPQLQYVHLPDCTEYST